MRYAVRTEKVGAAFPDLDWSWGRRFTRRGTKVALEVLKHCRRFFFFGGGKDKTECAHTHAGGQNVPAEPVSRSEGTRSSVDLSGDMNMLYRLGASQFCARHEKTTKPFLGRTLRCRCRCRHPRSMNCSHSATSSDGGTGRARD